MVSIIVPIYNAEKYLRECLDSIIAQTFTDWELILVDDGSTDSSGSIAESYARSNPKIKVIHVENGGLSWARNHGIDMARGDYLMFVDADDALYPDSIRLLMEAMNREGADIASGDFEEGVDFHNVSTAKFSVTIFTPAEAVENVLYQSRLLPSACGKIYRTEIFESLRYTEGLYYEDLDFFYRLFFKSKRIVHISAPVYFYRTTPGSILHTWNKRRLDVLKVTEIIEDFMAKNRPDLLPAARDRRLSANFNIFALASNNKECDVADTCWRVIKKYRKESLFNPKVRLKNKIGIMISYFGRGVLSCAGKIVYR